MELFFLAVLIVLMIIALGSGYPVAFALPGSAILTIALAAISGQIFAGDPAAYFAQGGPVQWLSAGVTNFRGVYWEVERDTLIAIPLFIFMGIMLQRSKIAEDLLVTMAQLFGPVPGGLGISVVVVGALLAAAYLLGMFRRVALGPASVGQRYKIWDLGRRELAAILPLAVFVFWVGLYPKPFLNIIHVSVEHLLQQVHGYDPGAKRP